VGRPIAGEDAPLSLPASLQSADHLASAQQCRMKLIDLPVSRICEYCAVRRRSEAKSQVRMVCTFSARAGSMKLGIMVLRNEYLSVPAHESEGRTHFGQHQTG
jgi:hypothetical protein